MRIVFLCPRFMTARGGAELHAWQLARGLVDKGHDVTFFAAQPGDGEKENRIGCDARITVKTFQRKAWPERWARWIRGLEDKRGGYRIVQCIRKSGRIDLVSKGPWCPGIADPWEYAEYDIAALMGFNTCWELLFAKTAQKLSKTIPVVIPLLHPREPSATLPIHHRFKDRYKHAIAKTEYEKAFLQKNGWDSARVSVSGVASDLQPGRYSAEEFRTRFGLSADAPIVLFLGRKIFNKGVAHLVQAMDLVWDRHPQARLVLAGFSHNPESWLKGYLSSCRNEAARKTISIDDIDDTLRESALEACSVMALPSISDSFGIAYLDAWRHRKPVIGCRDTCAQSVIEQRVNGMLVDFGDVSGLAEAVASLLAQPARAAEMGRQGFETWKARFQSAVIAGETEALFERLLVSERAADRAGTGSGSGAGSAA